MHFSMAGAVAEQSLRFSVEKQTYMVRILIIHALDAHLFYPKLNMCTA